VVRRIVRLRWHQRLGPVEITARLGVPASTVYAVLRRRRIHRLSHIDRRTGERVRRYEHDRPGSLLHVDVKKLGNIRRRRRLAQAGARAGQEEPSTERSHLRAPPEQVPPAADGHRVRAHRARRPSRVAYAEIQADETAATAIAVLRRAAAWFAARGVTVERVLPTTARPPAPAPGATPASSSGSSPSRPGPTGRRPTARSNAFTEPWPHGWAFRRMFLSELARRQALPAWLHEYNDYRPHTAIRTPPTDHPLDQPVWAVQLIAVCTSSPDASR
jgi:hypothetical protein